MYKMILAFQHKNEDKINLALNHLLVAYMFLIPFEQEKYSIDFIFSLMYLLLLIRGHYLKYIKLSLSHPITKAFLAFFLLHYIWLFGTTDMEFAQHFVLKYINYNLYPFFFFLFLDKRFYPRLITSFIVGVMLSELLSYLMQFQIIPLSYIINIHLPWNPEHLHEIVFYRSVSQEPIPFTEHSFYSALVALTASILLYRSTSQELSFTSRVISLIFFITMSSNIFFTGGRTGYLLYILLIFILFIYLYKNGLSKKYLFSIIAIPTIVIAVMFSSGGIFKQRVIHTIETITQESKSEARLLIAETGLKEVVNQPIFGLGTGDYISILRAKPENKDNPIQHLRDVHNQYIDIMLQFGIIGLMVYLNLLYQIIKFKSDAEEREAVKFLTISSMIITGFLASFWLFLPIIFTMLIVITTAKHMTIKHKIEMVQAKTIFMYSFIILLSYTIGQLQ